MPFPHRNFRAKRESLGYSREQLGQLADIPHRYIEALEQGRKPNPTQDTLERLCTALGVTCEFFFAPDLPAAPAADGRRGRPPQKPASGQPADTGGAKAKRKK